MVELLTTIRAEERHVVTASKCRIYCFNSYLIMFRNCAIIMRRCGSMETDEEGFSVGDFLMQFTATL